MIGLTISHYRITEKLGGGGMGVVYKAEDTRLKRSVALKFLPPDVVHDNDTKQRFIYEAQAASALQHNNICTIHEIDETSEGQMFIVMDHYGGGALKKKLESGPLGITEALGIALQIAEGLAEAHKCGIVHRDLKPGNIVIAENGAAKIVDFGLAKLAGDSRLTKTGEMLGTIAYMAPEQLQGAADDARTDIFAFGVMLFEMLAGRMPFQAEHEATMMYAIINDEPEPIDRYRQDVPARIVKLIHQCLEKDPANRYQTLQDCALALRGELNRSGGALRPIGTDGASVESALLGKHAEKKKVRTRQIGQPAKRRLYVTAASVVAVGTLVFAYLLTVSRSEEKEGVPIAATYSQVTDQDGQEFGPTISPNGEFVAYQKRVDGVWHILTQKIGGTSTTDVTKDLKLGCIDPKFSPTGDRIAFWSQGGGGGVYVVGVMGDSLRHVADIVGGGISWLPDGRTLLASKRNPGVAGASSGGELWLIDLSSGERRLLTQGGEFLEPLMSPHGKRIAFWRQGRGIAGIYTIPGAGGPLVSVTPDSFRSVSPHWSPDGKYIYFQSDRGGTWNLWRIAVNEETGELNGVPRPILTPSANSLLGSISKDGKRLIYMATHYNGILSRVPIDVGNARVRGKPSQVWTTSKLDFSKLAHSPDGEWIAASNNGNSSVRGDLFVIRMDGSGFRKLTDDPPEDILWQWSFDGKKILFVSNRNHQGYQVWAINSDGSGLEQLTKLTSKPEYVHLLPGGRTLSFNLYNQGSCLLDLTRPLDGRKAVPLPPFDSIGYRFHAWSMSPDGRRMFGGFADSAFKSTLAGSYLFDLETQKYSKVFAEQYPGASWHNDSRHLVFAQKGDFYVVDVKTKQKRLLLRSSDYSERPMRNGGISGDGKYLYLVVSNTQTDIWLATLQEDN
jgi:Tol biopolymer transport system component